MRGYYSRSGSAHEGHAVDLPTRVLDGGGSHAQAHQLAAIEHLERLHQELLVWRPPPPPPPPPPPKQSKWRGPMMDAYGEPIGGGEMAPAWALAPLELSCACSP